MPRNPNKTPCGIPGCRAWAIRGSHPPRCSPHRHATLEAGGSPDDDRATGTGGNTSPSSTASGPAKSLTVGAPPGNQNRAVHGFYSEVLRPEERADLLRYAADTSLDGEIAITRVALRRILGMLLTGRTAGPEPVPLGADDYARFVSLAFRGAGTISRLLRARQVLTGDTDELFSFLESVLEQLDAEDAARLEGAAANGSPDPDIEPQKKDPDARGPGATTLETAPKATIASTPAKPVSTGAAM
jgi:hypothetical protein